MEVMNQLFKKLAEAGGRVRPQWTCMLMNVKPSLHEQKHMWVIQDYRFHNV